MKIIEKFSLKPFNTFGIEVKSKYFVSIKNPEQLVELANTKIVEGENIFILGGGSNVLFINDFDGLIIKIDIKGINITESTEDYVNIEVGAGEQWHDFVSVTVKNKYFGLENLAMIPGNVGAAPVQNIGAYGSEQKDCFLSLKGFDFTKKEFKELKFKDCEFGYRTSVFKKNYMEHFVITNVKYKLSKKFKINLSYKELENEIKKFQVENPDQEYVFNAICRLRTRKLPNPPEIGNAGSFFKNPVIDKDHFELLKKNYPNIPGYDLGNNKVKLFAGWLIERCNLKGYRAGDAGIYPNHALILVNYGKATGIEILTLAKYIEKRIFQEFGIRLEKEVLIVG